MSAPVCRLCQPPEPVEDGDIFAHLRLFHPGWDEGGTPLTDVTAPFEYPVITAAGLEPYGARCGDCGREFHAGDRYTERPEGFAGDTPVVLVVCLDCAGVPAPGGQTGEQE